MNNFPPCCRKCNMQSVCETNGFLNLCKHGKELMEYRKNLSKPKPAISPIQTKEEVLKDLADRLSDKKLREISKRCGIDISTLCKILNANYNPSLNVLLKITGSMGLDITFKKHDNKK